MYLIHLDQSFAAMTKEIPIKDLPLYKSDELTVFVEDPPLALEPYMGGARQILEPAFEYFGSGTASLEKFGRSVTDQAQKMQDYIAGENQSAIPKAVAITLGGMGGFLLGMRRGGIIRRALYSGIGMGIMAAFCYPNQTVDISRTTVKTARKQWEDFVAPPPPPRSTD